MTQIRDKIGELRKFYLDIDKFRGLHFEDFAHTVFSDIVLISARDEVDVKTWRDNLNSLQSKIVYFFNKIRTP